MFGSKKRTDTQAWLLAVQQHLQLALEIYGGHPVRMEYLKTETTNSVYDGNSQIRQIRIEASVLSDGLMNGSQCIVEGELCLTTLEGRSYWWMRHAASLLISKSGILPKVYDVSFAYKVGDVMPYVRICEHYVADSPPECYFGVDKRARSGRHLGDRKIHDR